MPLTQPSELTAGQKYLIIGGPGEGQVGECFAVRESNFGQKWGYIRTGVGSFWTRYQLLEPAEG